MLIMQGTPSPRDASRQGAERGSEMRFSGGLALLEGFR